RVILSVSRPGAKLLEIGCARGYLLKLAKDIGYDVQGVEVSSYASDIARNAGLSVFNGTMKDISLAENSFDVVVAIDVIEHVVDPINFLLTVKKYLKQGGMLVLKTPNISSIFARIGGKNWIGFNPYHIFLFSPDTLGSLCNKTGFDIVRLETEEVSFCSMDGLRRLGMGRFLGSKVNRVIESRFRRRVSSENQGVRNTRELDIDLSRRREGLFGSWMKSRYLGDQIIACARPSE
ncbi:MAG: methyltransferase domain-containing protein, partial [Candidatus Aminicenantes bacterium]|nr:methyltransferase domain-containing protein [Candidatus Aminicenantes bacterium]NIQ72955.1 methyltransferase domain-containing protein [Candidatus Aminicenantes bacterium]NIT28990.1 methyltransferase domain-containing protein [Candidatus Aminicenantes bacterium]